MVPYAPGRLHGGGGCSKELHVATVVVERKRLGQRKPSVERLVVEREEGQGASVRFAEQRESLAKLKAKAEAYFNKKG